MINKVILVGNLGQEPDIKFTGEGKAVAILTVATSESWTDKTTGQKQEKTEWHRVVIYDRLADIAQKYLHKGSKVYIEGQLRTRSWDKNGEKKYSTEVVLSQFNSTLQMLNKVTQEPSQEEAEEKPPQEKITPVAKDDFEDDIPF